jgi:hypothetical protein
MTFEEWTGVAVYLVVGLLVLWVWRWWMARRGTKDPRFYWIAIWLGWPYAAIALMLVGLWNLVGLLPGVQKGLALFGGGIATVWTGLIALLLIAVGIGVLLVLAGLALKVVLAVARS